MAREKISGIYCIENLVNGKKYIGKSVNISKRWSEHKRALKSNQHYNKHLQKAWNKYGELNFKFSVIKYCNTEEELNNFEMYYINKFNTINSQYGYNITSGGEGAIGYHHTEEIKKYISTIQTGRLLSENWRKNISSAHKDRIKNGLMPKTEHFEKYNEEKSRPINCYDKNTGKYIETFESIQEASRKLSLEATNISKVIQRQYKYCGNYYFSDSDILLDEWEVILKSGKNPIYEIDNKMNKIGIYPNALECARQLELDPSSIVKVCRGKQSSVKGHYFAYA